MHSPAPRRARGVLATASLAVAAGLIITTGAAAFAAPQAPAGSIPSSATSVAVAAETPAGDRSSFVLPVLPDTQFYSRYSASQFVPSYGTNPFEVQAQWIVEHQDELDMPFTVHVGDVVDQEWVGGEWDAAAKAMRILTDGGMPYSVVPGNHDVKNSGARSSVASSGNYLARFGAANLAAQAGPALIGTFQDGLSSAYLFEAEGHTWMSLALAWNASDDTFTWAQGILDAHPGVPVILSSHAIINIAEDQVSPASWGWGEELWEKLIRRNDQIILTLNGHFHGATSQTRLNDAGNPVHQVLTDYQMAADGGNGIMSLFEFDLSNNAIDVETVSPWVAVKHLESLTSSDRPVLDGTWQSFSLPLDFGARFGWTVDPADENGIDLSERAKQIVSKDWDGDDAGAALHAPGNAQDYLTADGTVAHWRFGDVAAGAVDENTVVPDVAGESPMFRNPIDETDAPEELDDLTVTHENSAFYSADLGAACFSNVYRDPDGGPDRLSYLTTEYGAPATFADLDADQGYTLETFLQLDPEWTETDNRWSSAITRGGAREWAGIRDSSDPGAGASWLGISNLREYQFSAADTATANSYTLWSGEIMPGAWHHVAIVNDPAKRTVIMYVDGVPVLRNASGVGGMIAEDYMPWMIGTSTWYTEPDHGWHGCVGETRIVERALDTGEFLYNRVDIDGDGGAFALGTDLSQVQPADAEIAAFEGTGHPGASVRVEVAGAMRGTAEVGADGRWAVALDDAIAGSGSHPLSFVQSMGSRDGTPYEAVVVIAEDAGWAPADPETMPDLQGRITITPETFAPGDTITIELPEEYDGTEISAFAFSSPTALGAGTVADGAISLTTPVTLAPGVHRVAAYTAEGEMIGWNTVFVDPGAGSGGPDAGSGSGSDPGSDSGPGSGSGSGSGDAAGEVAGSPSASELAVTGITTTVLVVLALAAAAAVVLGVFAVRRRRVG
ncbi:LamG-like jellyroll fold domain-containing protein [Microbacterium sp. NPDC056044]|uniref:LamG-like jellyroll fold domain-containing protein n=1 Tax=Microbacterium sp. NPDC056044 TaxID=3345690 RepID=UPI0035D5726E